MAEETLGEKVVGGALRFYDRHADRKTIATNRRVFLESVMDKRKDPITEASFTPVELTELANVIGAKYANLHEDTDRYAAYLQNELAAHAAAVKAKDRDHMRYPEFVAQYEKDLTAIKAFKAGKFTQDFLDLASGTPTYERSMALRNASKGGTDLQKAFNVKPYVTYDDYKQTKEDARSAHTIWATNPRAMLRTTLGQFQYSVDPKTNALVVTDTYDFNPPKSFLGLGPTTTPLPVGETDVAEGGPAAGGLYGLIRQYAGRAMPPGAGRPVRVQVNALAPTLQNNLVK